MLAFADGGGSDTGAFQRALAHGAVFALGASYVFGLATSLTPCVYPMIAITVSVFGGTAPAVALYFKSLGHEDWFYYYLSGMICLSLIIYSTMRDTKHESAMHRHE